MIFKNLIMQIDEGIATITLNRPEVLNALNNQVFNELALAAEEITRNNSIRAVIITGGDQVFAAGADIGPLATADAVDVATTDKPSARAFRLIENIPKPVIAAVAGYALGGGCELSLVADIRIAAENASFGLPEIKLGIIPGAGGTQRLPRLIGPGRAKEMIFSGELINSAEAWRIGLVNKVVPSDQLLPEAMKLAKRYSSRGAVALRMAKSAVNVGLKMELEAGLQYERQCFNLLFATQDQKEGMKAFQEKRKPQFQGK